MGEIYLNNIRLYAYHGCLAEEAIIGSDYRVDLVLTTSLTLSCQTDDLNDTIDYVTATEIVSKEMAIRSKLLEHVAQRIISSLFTQFTTLNHATVRVAKINPPIGADVESVEIKLSLDRNTWAKQNF